MVGIGDDQSAKPFCIEFIIQKSEMVLVSLEEGKGMRARSREAEIQLLHLGTSVHIYH